MQFLFEILPIFLFFISFKFYGIYTATVVGIAATFVQVITNRLWFSKWDNKQLLTLLIFVVFGGMTLYFHNPIFVKWKPTIVFWFFAVSILVTHFFTKRPMMQRLMQHMIDAKGTIPLFVWQRLNMMWALFFLLLGTINLYVAYEYSNDAWVNFKFYGISVALIIVSILQAVYLSRYLIEEKVGNDKH